MEQRLIELPKLGKTDRCPALGQEIAEPGKRFLKGIGPPRLEQPRADLLGLESTSRCKKSMAPR
jgi:hypothetical protein